MTDLTTAPSKQAKIIAAVLAFAAAAALGWASFSGRWMVITQDESTGNFGLRSMEACLRDSCTGESNLSFIDDATQGGAEHASSAFGYAGWICSVALWLAAAALAAAAALMLAGRFIARPIALTTLALLGLAIALISGVVFVAVKPDPTMGPGPACFAFAAGELIGIIATILVARIRPADPEWDDPEKFDEDKWGEGEP